MRGIATTMASVLALCAFTTAASADPQTVREDVMTQAPASTEPAFVVPLIEYGQPVPVAQAPLPQPRPVRIAAPRQDRPVVRRPVVAQVAEPAPRQESQRVALAAKPRSPLFWMTVGVGF